ncbi:DUF7520 family protein [Candidatus Halobonum tyrrellensis]|uniref:Cox cluster protein n=1 Tax=Candidatus Halobonum tyrrellensis G22 TaxID=1324957 RepID=V4J3B3_9EURY|nr:hypothetical protein [Candidatus Halobonum tyrrellensis]ESP89877.1 hypothetical protein K933_01607 [Candidatus Halobonum tyrrellensis G22]
MSDTDGGPGREAERGFDGPRLVVALYCLLVGVGVVGGALVGVFVEGMTAPHLFGVLALPPTPVGFAAYGGVTVATMLGVPLAGVVYLSRRLDDPHAVDE